MFRVTRAKWLGLLLASVAVFVGAGRQADVLGFVMGKESTVSVPIAFPVLYATGDFEGEAMVLPGVYSPVVGMLTQVYVPADFSVSSGDITGLPIPEGTDPRSLTQASLRGICYFRKAITISQVFARFSPDRGRTDSACTLLFVDARGKVTVLADATFAIREQRMEPAPVAVPMQRVYEQVSYDRQPCREAPSSSKEFKRKIVHDVIGMALQKISR